MQSDAIRVSQISIHAREGMVAIVSFKLMTIEETITVPLMKFRLQPLLGMRMMKGSSELCNPKWSQKRLSLKESVRRTKTLVYQNNNNSYL